MKDIDIYHYPVPYVTFHGVPDSVVTKKDHMNQNGTIVEIKLNELGFRIEKPLLKEKPPEETRIFIVGSSTIFNGTPLEMSIPGQVETCFRKNGKDNVQVYNFGFVSSVSGQELALLVHLLSSYEPDIVVVYNGGNDVCLPANFDPRPGYPYNFFVYESAMRRIRHEMVDNYYNWVLEGEGLDYDLVKLRTSCGYGTEEWEMNVAAKYVENTLKMGRFARACGFKLFAFLEPIFFLKDPVVGKEKDISTTCYSITGFDHYIVRQYEKIRKMFKYLQNAEGGNDMMFIDLSRIFQGYDRDTYWDFRHVDNEGNRYIAENIYTYLQGSV